jgi:hypothetical protein
VQFLRERRLARSEPAVDPDDQRHKLSVACAAGKQSLWLPDALSLEPADVIGAAPGHGSGQLALAVNDPQVSPSSTGVQQQQPQRTEPAGLDPRRPAGPASTTSLILDRKEKISGWSR